MRIDVDVIGDDAAARMLRAVGRRAIDVSPVWRRVAGVIMRRARDRFTAQHWRPLDADTIKRKGHARILHDTGRLQRALTVWNADGQRFYTDPDQMVFGLSPRGPAYYGAFHQHGRGVPRREVVPGMSPRDISQVKDALAEHIAGYRT